jgi:cytochrome c-type biogenesis protein CcmH
VLYRPPLRATTVLLWIGPFLLLAAGIGVFIRVARRAPAAQAGAPSGDAARIAALLEDEESGRKP